MGSFSREVPFGICINLVGMTTGCLYRGVGAGRIIGDFQSI